jgi:hypothetical protein
MVTDIPPGVPRFVVAALSVVLVAAAPVVAQGPSDARVTGSDARALRAEVDALRAEVSALRAEVEALSALRAMPGEMRAGAAPPRAGPTDDVKAPRQADRGVRVSGTILANTFVNSSDANWLDNPNIVNASSLANGTSGSMSTTVRQSRLGLEVPEFAFRDWNVSAAITADFVGGVPGFETGSVLGLRRLVNAFARVARDRTAIQVGQDQVLLAPRDPTSLAAFSFPLLYRSGNLYLRAPGVRVERQLNDRWHAAVGFVAPVAGDAASAFQFAPAAGAGERSKLPGLEARIGIGHDAPDAPREAALGVSGHVSRRRSGGLDDATWAVAVDVRARRGRAGVTGEWFVARNAEAFGGALAQLGTATGGWLEGQYAVTGAAAVNAGFGLDRPTDAVGRLVLTENRTLFANVLFTLSPELAVSAEYRWLETRLGFVPVARQNHHLNLVFALKF